MNKTVKILAILILFLIVVPLIAGAIASALWNNILIDACGLSPIGLWEGVGLFILVQFLSGGFILGCFLAADGIHRAVSHPGGELARQWHKMTQEERKEFIERRRRFGGHHHKDIYGDAAE